MERVNEYYDVLISLIIEQGWKKCLSRYIEG